MNAGGLSRAAVVQRLLDLFVRPRYLEIGVNEGLTFDAVTAARKVAVDPDFRFDLAAARAAAPASVAYHEIESDAYFAGTDPRRDTFDVVFIDGLHVFDQVLRDLMNAVDHLAEGGVILIDDVLPVSYGASLREVEDSAKYRRMTGDTGPKAWMGDVFRLVFFIRDYLPSFRYATVADNHGQTILWRGRRRLDRPPLTIEAISRLEYKDVVFRPRAYAFAPLDEIVARIGQDRAG